MVLALVGGLLIGFAASLLLFGSLRVLGVSGILANVLAPVNPENFWRYSFIAGLLVTSLIMHAYFPQLFQYNLEAPLWRVLLAGILVGYGTRLGSGCTSGHGVCGLSRFSKRSLVATITFMISGVLTVLIVGAL